MLSRDKEYFFDSNAESTLDHRHRNFLDNLKLRNEPNMNALPISYVKNFRNTRDNGFGSNALLKPGNKSDAMMTKYTDMTRANINDEARKAAYSST
jgi:hypothetical protein